MKVSEMFPSKFLGKADLTRPAVGVIDYLAEEEISGDGGKESKHVIHFRGDAPKPLILNRGNADALAEYFGDDSDGWVGKRIEVYVDPSVMFGGKRIGGIRVRVPGGQANAAGAVSVAAAELFDLSDGTQLWPKLDRDQVQEIIDESGEPARVFKVKPAGAGKDQAKTADLCGFMNGPPKTEPVNNGGIPF